jgi:hypothetical protein
MDMVVGAGDATQRLQASKQPSGRSKTPSVAEAVLITAFNAALKRCSAQVKIRRKITSDVRPTFVPVDVHNLLVLMCNYTGKEVV